MHITLTSFDFCLICKKNPAVVFHIFFVFHVNCTNIRDVYITLIFDNLCKDIPAVELSLFFFLQNIACRVPHFPGSVYQYGVYKWFMDSVHTKENPVCYHIDSFSLVYYLIENVQVLKF